MVSLINKKERGFTLIEVMVVVAIIGFMTAVFIRNFSINRLYLNEAMNIVLADIRNMQQQSIAGANYPDQVGVLVPRCGYGVSRASSTTYRLYVAPQPHLNPQNDFCAGLNKNYTTIGDPIHVRDVSIQVKSLPNPKIEFKTNFTDIFFEPPDPKIYIDNSSTLASPPSIITIGPVGQACAGSNCVTICVYTSGALNTASGASCP